MPAYVVGFPAINGTMEAQVGGKGARLGELARIDGIPVPPGFCVTTAAFERALGALSGLAQDDGGAALRAAIAAAPLPEDVAAAIAAWLRDGVPYAVRSSATAARPRVVLGRRPLSRAPEPADHHALPDS